MAIDITPFLTPYTPPGAGYSPTGPYGRHLVAVTEKFAGLADKRRAQELEDAKFRLQQEKQAEVRRSARASEVHNREVLDESKRSAIEREGDASLTQTRMRRKQAATLFKSAKAMDTAGDHEAAKILLSLAGFGADELQSPAEVTAAVEGLGQAVASAEATAEMLGEPGDPLTKQEKLDKLGFEQPPPLPGMAPAGQPAGAVPRETLAAPAGAPAPAHPAQAGAPPLAGGPPLAAPGAAQPAYDPSQVPAGMAPPGVSREQYLVDQRAQEPAFARQVALPALPGQAPGGELGLGDMAHPAEQAGANIAASERAPEMRITTPFGETFDYSPGARNEEVRAQVNDHFTRYMEGADPMDMPAAVQVRNMADSALDLHGGDAKATAKYLDTILDRKEGEIHADYRKEIGVEASIALQGAKRAAEKGKGPGYDRRFMQAYSRVQAEARQQGYYKTTTSLGYLRQAEGLLRSGDGHSQQLGMSMLRDGVESGVMTDKDIERIKYGYTSIATKVSGWFSEAKDGVLKPAHVESVLGTLNKMRIANLKFLQRVRNTLDSQGDDMPDGAISDAWRAWTNGSFSRFKIRRQRSPDEEIRAAQERRAYGTPMDPRRVKVPKREDVRAEADMIERAQGPDAKKQFLQDQGIEDIDATIDDLLMEAAGVAP